MILTLRAIIKWEQLRGKPFSEMDYMSETDVMSLIYVIKLLAGLKKTYSEFLKEKGTNDIDSTLKKLQHEILVISQFQSKKENEQTESTSDNTSHNPIFMKDVVSTLILEGLDTNYALHEMDLSELPIFLSSYENKKKEKLEADRLQSFYSVLPHISKGLKKPQDLYKFYWETEAKKEAATDEDIEMFRKFKASADSTL